MSELIVYTPQNIDVFRDVINSVAMLSNSETFTTAKECFLVFSGCIAAAQLVLGDKIQILSRYFITTFFVIACLIGINVSVAVVDMQQEGGKAVTVDNVPLGLALPASFVSRFGRGFVRAFEDVLHMPDDLEYSKSGMVFGARTWLSATSANFNGSPELSKDISTFIRQCVFSARLLGSQKVTAKELVHSKDLNSLFFDSNNQSPIFRTIFHDGEERSCAESAVYLKKRIPAAVEAEIESLSKIMTQGDSKKYKDTLLAAHQYYKGQAKSAANIMTQNILINATRSAARDAFAFHGADADLMNLTNSESLQKMHVAEANSFWLACFRLPYFMTAFWMLTIAIFPIVALLSLFPSTQNVYKVYLQSQLYLWTWPLFFIVIHYLVSSSASAYVNLFNESKGAISFSNIDQLSSIQANLAYTAGALAASVPFLAYYATKGIAAVLGNAAQHFGGMVQSMSTSIAQSAASGNISMATYSGWNANYDNTSAHKYDTNYSFAEGRLSAQASNGSMISRNPDGSSVTNVQGAMSNAAVGVHGSERVIDSLNQNAQQSFHNAAQLRTSAESSLQQGLSNLSQFNDNHSIDTKGGIGISQSDNNSYTKDIKTMQDAIQQYNSHRDKSDQITWGQAVSANFNTGSSVVGKVTELTTGVSASAQISTGHNNSSNESIQDFFDSSEGKSFSSAFSHMTSTAKNQHLDVGDSSSLSGSEQIAANFTKAKNLHEQSSQEFSKGLHYQRASTHAKEHASNIDSNFAQAFHDFVENRYGASGLQTMLGTDANSIHKQQGYADEFMKSGVGQSLIEQQVQQEINGAKYSMKSNYDSGAAAIKNTASHNIKRAHQSASAVVDNKIEQHGIKQTELDNNRQQQVDELMGEYQSSSPFDAYKHQKEVTADAIRHQKDGLSKAHQGQRAKAEKKLD